MDGSFERNYKREQEIRRQYNEADAQGSGEGRAAAKAAYQEFRNSIMARRFFRRGPSEAGKNERMKFIALKTKDGELKGDIFFYCRILHASRQGFYRYPANKDRPWKYQPLADAMMEILEEDDCNDTCGRIRMYQAFSFSRMT